MNELLKKSCERIIFFLNSLEAHAAREGVEIADSLILCEGEDDILTFKDFKNLRSSYFSYLSREKLFLEFTK